MAEPTKITLAELPGYLGTQGASFVEGANYIPYMAQRGYTLRGTGNDAYWEKTGAPGVVGTPVTPLQKFQNIAMTGELPEDVVQAIQRRAAEFGVATGMPGSELAGYGGLRQLGLTSLDVLKDAAKYDITPYQQQVLQTQQLSDAQRTQLALEEASNQRNAQLADIWRRTTGTTPGYTMTGGAAGTSGVSSVPATTSRTGGYATSPYGTASSPLMMSAPPSQLDVLLSAINQGTSPSGSPSSAGLQTGYQFGNSPLDTYQFSGLNPSWYPEVNAPRSNEGVWLGSSPFAGYAGGGYAALSPEESEFLYD